jgi:hypothetical protein
VGHPTESPLRLKQACAPDALPAETAIGQCTGAAPLYWRTSPKPWFDVIEVERILCMEPVVPDFYNDGKIPPEARARRAPNGAVGDYLVVRNTLAREFGRCRPHHGSM